MELQVSLPTYETSTNELPVDPTACVKLVIIRADIRKYTLIPLVKGYKNMTLSLRQSNSQDDNDPTFVAMTKKLTTCENILEKSVSEFGSLPYCNIPDCPVHETPTSSPLKTQLTKREDNDGDTFPPLKNY
ncbi:hypothetical protein TNCT_96161 [Trichonephila clavata]|uniref:Uncharacterized protein n=1 Tax=Trichonephila clavata TaxID=2740835 RepID=A0A8X6G125_TRICU|nr:hypothetical protein TNCT_96161 [Trichonephila clavata]